MLRANYLKIGSAFLTADTTNTNTSTINLPSGSKIIDDEISGKTYDTTQLTFTNKTNTVNTIKYESEVYLTETSITSKLNNYSENQQIFTFGPSQSNMIIAVGDKTNNNALAYSTDGGFTFNSVDTFALNFNGRCIKWNGNIWLAGSTVIASENNALIYSYNGKNWYGLGNSMFSTRCNDLEWNGKMWVAVGSGTNEIVYSNDGINWTAATTQPFTNEGFGVAWNGNLWVAVGKKNGTAANTIQYSSDGDTWTASSGNGFATAGHAVVWTGQNWIAVGDDNGGSNPIQYSSDGITWTNATTTSVFTGAGQGIAWNGSMLVAVGSGGNTIATSMDLGKTWTGLGITYLGSGGWGIAWTGDKWIATGDTGTSNEVVYSYNGTDWFVSTCTTFNGNAALGVATNTKRSGQITVPTNLMVAGGGQTDDTADATIAYSYDGITWIDAANKVFGRRTWVVKNNGKMWIAGGEPNPIENSMAFSYDGINWTGLGKSLMNNVRDLLWDGTKWIATGIGNYIFAYSYDGITWIGVGGTSTFSSGGLGIDTDGTIIVAAGNSNSVEPNNTLAYSYDGINWTGLGGTIFNKFGLAIVWNGSMWVAVGQGNNSFAYSYDGLTWNGLGVSVFTTGGRNVAWNGYMWVAVGQGQADTIAYSYDGLNWTGAGKIIATAAWGIVWNGNMWVAAGSSGNSPEFAYSYDGISWTGIGGGGSNLTKIVRNVAWNGNQNAHVKITQPMIAVGAGSDNTLAYSQDGMYWEGLGDTVFTTQGNGVAWNGIMWVATGEGTNTLAYSYNGKKWIGLGTSIFTTRAYGVAWNGTIWVSAGEGTNTLAYSPDGIHWTGLGNIIFNTAGRSVAWNGSLWCVVGSDIGGTTIATSSNGMDWTAATSGSFSTAGYGVLWVVQQWIAVGTGGGTIKYSTDGDTWTDATTGGFITAGYSIAFNGMRAVAAGDDNTGSTTIQYSTNWGEDWTSATTIPSGERYGVAWNDNIWTAVGDSNPIIFSNDGDVWHEKLDSNTIFTTGNGVAGNPKIGAVNIPSKIYVDNLDISSDTYYGAGLDEISVTVNATINDN